MMLVILNFRKDVNFIGQTVRRPGILLDFEAFSIYSLRNSSTRSNSLKLSTITPTELVNNSMKKKVKQIRFPADVIKNCTKICPKFAFFFKFFYFETWTQNFANILPSNSEIFFIHTIAPTSLVNKSV